MSDNTSDPLEAEPDASAHTDTAQEPSQIASDHPADAWWEGEGKRVDSQGDPTMVGNTLYAWQMRVDNAWNVIGVTMPTGQTLPLVTTSMRVAWEAFEVAQAHANRNQCECRLAAFALGSVAAIVVPND